MTTEHEYADCNETDDTMHRQGATDYRQVALLVAEAKMAKICCWN